MSNIPAVRRSRFFDRLPTSNDFIGGLRFLTGLPNLLRYRVNIESARTALAHRLANREANFLTLAKQVIYHYSPSPYRKLLVLAGCEYGDLENIVRKDGIEGALSKLYRRGVYLTVSEAKGREPVVRGSAKFTILPGELNKPGVAGALVGESGGSGGSKIFVPTDFDLDRLHSAEMLLDFEARGGSHWIRAIWTAPGTAALRRVINYTHCGSPPERWFSLVEINGNQLHPRYLWSTRALRAAGLTVGVTIPRPAYVPLQNPLEIVHWMSATLRAGHTPQLYTYSSCAVRLCQAAIAAGVDLKGAQFIVGGEPTTASRLADIERAGATAHVSCGTVETSFLGRGCMARQAADDVHFVHDRLAVIQPGDCPQPNLPKNALLLTSVYHPMAKLILLNVSLGDEALVERRSCDCPLDALGWKTHLRHIRSFEKLTAGGMTFLDADLIRTLEEKLPARFGGGPTDYQLIDAESEDGRPSVRLRVHPRLGVLDAADLREAFLEGIAEGAGVKRVMTLVWRDASLPIIEREEPHVTGGGKVLHVHRARALGRDSDLTTNRQRAT